MRFIGCKINLLPFIESSVKDKGITGGVFCDLFAGTASVGKRFKELGYSVVSNDILYFSYVLQKTYLETNEYPEFARVLRHLGFKTPCADLCACGGKPAHHVLQHLNELPGIKGFIYRNYSCEGTKNQEHVRMYFWSDNAARIDAIRIGIEDWNNQGLLTEQEYYFLLTALIEAVPFVSNISGTYSAFLKTWDKRAHKRLTLTMPVIIPSKRDHQAFNDNGVEVVGTLGGVDVLYLDPPYNSRQYAPNYHILETIAKSDNPPLKGKTGMRDYSTQKSDFCNGKTALKSLDRILQKGGFKHLFLSYNDEGVMPEQAIVNSLEKYGKVEIVSRNYQRYKSNSNGSGKAGVKEKLYYLKPVHAKNMLNDHSGAEWLYFLNSVEVTNYPTRGVEGYAHHLRKNHPSPKPPQLMKKIVAFFTKEGQLVFDPFMGVGGTLLGCSLTNRKGLGIDLSEHYISLYEEVCGELSLKKQKTVAGDSLLLDQLLRKNVRFDFILTDPPYGNMLSKKRTGERKKKTGVAKSTPFTDNECDLGNMTKSEFLDALCHVLTLACARLKAKGYMAVFVKDMQPKGKQHNMLHCEIATKLLTIPDMSFRGLKIWHDQSQKLYPFGYPHAFVANQFHQYILIFRKEK